MLVRLGNLPEEPAQFEPLRGDERTHRPNLPSGNSMQWRETMTPRRLLLLVLTALAGIGAVYFWLIHVAAAALSFLVVLFVLAAGPLFLRKRRNRGSDQTGHSR